MPPICARLFSLSGEVVFQGPCTAAQLGQWNTVGKDKKRDIQEFGEDLEYLSDNEIDLEERNSYASRNKAAVNGSNNKIDGVTWSGSPGMWYKIGGGCTQTIICNADGSFSDGGCCCNVAAAAACICKNGFNWPCGMCVWFNPSVTSGPASGPPEGTILPE